MKIVESWTNRCMDVFNAVEHISHKYRLWYDVDTADIDFQRGWLRGGGRTDFELALHEAHEDKTAEILVVTRGDNHEYDKEYLAKIGSLLESFGFQVTATLENDL